MSRTRLSVVRALAIAQGALGTIVFSIVLRVAIAPPFGVALERTATAVMIGLSAVFIVLEVALIAAATRPPRTMNAMANLLSALILLLSVVIVVLGAVTGLELGYELFLVTILVLPPLALLLLSSEWIARFLRHGYK